MCFRIVLVVSLVPVLLSLAACSPSNDPNGTGQHQASRPLPFIDVTAAAGLDGFVHDNGERGRKWYPEQMGSGAGFIDFDADGWMDILLLGGGSWDQQPKPGYRSLSLYRNRGDGTFADATAAAGLEDVRAYTIGMAAADYDNDGDQDFLLTNLGVNMLFKNEGGRFLEVGAMAGLAGVSEWSSSALFFDADRDGWLDLYVGNYAKWTPQTDKFCPEGAPVKLYCVPADYEGVPSRYYHSNGDGTFTEKTSEAGFVPAPGKSLGMAEMDFNNDGWPDFAVANDGEGDLLYQNNGDGTFSDRGVLSGFAFSEHGEARAGMGIDAGVVDSSGAVSIIVGNFSEEMAGVYRHAGNGLFIDRAAASKVGHASLLTLTFGLFLFDADLDTDLDLFTANGHVYPDRLEGQDKITFRQPSQLYLNRGNGIFDELQQGQGVLTHLMVARGAAYADYDQDGDPDILIVENGGPAHLWRNEQQGGRSLRISLEGRKSNRDAFGARILAQVGALRMERRIRSGSSYLSQSETAATFGLGIHTMVDSLWIYWPSGGVDRYGPLPGGQALHFVEGEEAYQAQAFPAGPSPYHPPKSP